MPKPAITRVSNLEITPSSTNKEKGFYTAPITTTQRDAMTQADGSFIYNTTTKTFQGRQNGVWNNTYTQSSLGFSFPYTQKNDAYTAVVTDVIIGVDTSAKANTITLPAVNTTTAGQIVIVKDESNNANNKNITITPNGTDKIDTLNNPVTIANASGVVSLYSSGTAWLTIEKRV